MRNPIAICLFAATAAACSGQSGNNAAGNGANAAANTAAPAPSANVATANNAAPAATGNAAASAAPSTLSARGTEPFWALAIGGGTMNYTPADGANISVAAPAPQAIVNGYEWVTIPLTVRITNVACIEASGQSVPYTVQVIIGTAAPLNGCGQ